MGSPRLVPLAAAALLAAASAALAGGGTMSVAREGEPAYVGEAAPEGAGMLINHPLRTFGMRSWFSEWPNDVSHYGYKVESTAQINELIGNLAAVKSELKQVRLSPQPEPGVLGWTTRLDTGNATPILFSLGDQRQVDQWYEHVDKPFGVLKFADTPVAVPPTLTVYVGHPAVVLDDLKIPAGLKVVAGGTPSQFYDWKLAEPRAEKRRPADVSLTVKLTATFIESFLKERDAAENGPDGQDHEDFEGKAADED